jgi:preprotein translocase subunit SecF
MNWLKYKAIYFTISITLIIVSIFSLVKNGLSLSIEFTGGSTVEIKTFLSPDQIREYLPDWKINQIDINQDNLKLTLDPISQQDLETIKQKLQEKDEAVVISQFETVGPILGEQTLRKTFYAILIAAALILTFVARTFKKLNFGVCAILAMFHDTLILIGSFSLIGYFLNIETDLLFVTAVLTTLSFSVHDTIVVYDRIRELSRKTKFVKFDDIANQALSQTMSRSINNSLTIIFMLTALVFLGGETIKGFAIALLIGTVAGTYSSPFVAVPLLSVWNKLVKKQ